MNAKLMGRFAVIAAVALLGGAAAGRAAEEADGPPVKEIKMYASNWDWSPDTIRVPVGTLVRITVENVDATHRFDLKEYKLKVVLRQDSTTEFEFLADRVGEFRWRCGRPCGNGCAKMNGKLVVTEAGE